MLQFVCSITNEMTKLLLQTETQNHIMHKFPSITDIVIIPNIILIIVLLIVPDTVIIMKECKHFSSNRMLKAPATSSSQNPILITHGLILVMFEVKCSTQYVVSFGNKVIKLSTETHQGQSILHKCMYVSSHRCVSYA